VKQEAALATWYQNPAVAMYCVAKTARAALLTKPYGCVASKQLSCCVFVKQVAALRLLCIAPFGMQKPLEADPCYVLRSKNR
jgi:hypothetical protein